jgi:hypothetical protein
MEMPATTPLWIAPTNLFIAGLPAALRGTDLFLLVDHSEVAQTANSQHVIVREDLTAKDGYHAGLLRFSPNVPRPGKLLLKFEDPEGCAPLTGFNPETWQMMTQLPRTWMVFAGDQLCLGVQAAPLENLPGVGHPPGIWTIPVAELEQKFPTDSTRQTAHAN